MKTKSVVITINADGSIEVAGQGFKGTECEKATKALQDALGKTTGSKKLPEYYQQNVNTHTA